MKKFLTLVLALVLAFGLTVPAMAFTSDDSAADESVPYELSIYLVEYDDNDLFGIIALPESDRGYAKNEIVAAVVELFVPEDEDLFGDGYTSLDISGDNVTFDVSDAPIYNTQAAAEDALGEVGTNGKDGWEFVIGANDLDDADDDVTYKWLVFAKVTDDDASITAKLVDGTEGDEFASDNDAITVTIDGVNYTITKAFNDGGTYTIAWDEDDGDTNPLTLDSSIIIDVDEDYVSTGMSITYDPDGNGTTSAPIALGVNTDGELGLVKLAVIDTSGDDYDDIMDIYEDVVVDVFGMDYFLIGNYVRDSFFEDLTSGDTLVATVDIEPWTAYVTVPDNIVVDPPKTGDAASIMGFVMVALSGAGAVALKKRG